MACDYLSILIPMHIFAEASSPPTKMYQQLHHCEDQTAVTKFKTMLYAMKTKQLPTNCLLEISKEYLHPLRALNGISLYEAIGNKKITSFQKGTKWRFQSIRTDPAIDGLSWESWRYNGIRKQDFEGQTFEVSCVTYRAVKMPPSDVSRPEPFRRGINLRNVFDHSRVISIVASERGNKFWISILGDILIEREIHLDQYYTVVEQIFGDIPNAQVMRKIYDEKLKFINEIRDVSIKASNGMFLEWKDEEDNHQITATALDNKTPNAEWLMSFEMHKIFGITIVRIMNEAKAFADDAAFIQFNKKDGTVDNNGFYKRGICLEWCWMRMKANTEDGRVTFQAVSSDSKRLNYLCINPETGIVIDTGNPESEDAFFELYIGDKKMELSDFQRSHEYDSDIIDIERTPGTPSNVSTTGSTTVDLQNSSVSLPDPPILSDKKHAEVFDEEEPKSNEKDESKDADIVNGIILNRWLFYGLVAGATLISIACFLSLLFAVMKNRKMSKEKPHMIGSVERVMSVTEQKPINNNEPVAIKITKDVSFKVKPLNEWKSNKMTRKSEDDLFELFEGDDVTETIDNLNI